MKRTWTILLAGLLIAALTAPALAWEFEMTGEAEFRYRYFARQGQNDLFGGPAGIGPSPGGAVVATGTIGLAGPVANTVRVQGFSAKGSDASISDQRIWLFPDIRVNPAIRLRGEYWVTGTNLRGLYDGGGAGSAPYAYPADSWTLPNGYSGWFIQNDGSNGNRTTPTGMSVGMWEKFWLTAQTPWGIFAVGRRPFPFGLGWSVANERDASSESWLIAAPYGPFTIGGYVHTRVVGGDFFAENAGAIFTTTSPNFQGGVTPTAAIAAGTDKNRARQDFGPYIVYRDGPVELGIFQEYVRYNDVHTNLSTASVAGAIVPAGPAGADDFTNAALPATFLGSALALNSPAAGANGAQAMVGDINYILGINYFKYFNGRFFLNAEYVYEYGDIPKKGGRPVSAWGQAWMGEIGAICGPSKLSLAAFRSSGADRRGGVFNVTSPIGGPVGTGSAANLGANVYDGYNEFLPFSGREIVTLPYMWLIGIYGSGTNSFDARGKPSYRDFFAYAARLDYAVAANLNVSGSFAYMNRDSNTGTPIGAYRGGIPNTTGIRPHPGYSVVPGTSGAQVVPIPNVPDNYLGWEANLGVNWKLLEGMTFNALFAYWQPGDWFKWAYTDFGSLTTTSVSYTTGTGGTGTLVIPVNPNRGIDPLIGFQCSVLVDF